MAELTCSICRTDGLTSGTSLNYAWCGARPLLAFVVETEGGIGNDAQLGMEHGALVCSMRRTLWIAPSWRSKGEDVAVLRTRGDKEFPTRRQR